MAVVVTVAQALTLRTFDFRLDPSQASVSLGVVLIWLGASVVWILACSRDWYKVGLRACIKKASPSIFARYQHWDMEREVFGTTGLPFLVVETIWACFTIWVTIWKIARATTPFSVEPTELLITFAACFLMPFLWVSSGYRNGETKREKLDALRPTFHARFSVSEILSMYECLRLSPPVFWNEYTELPEWEINKTTNQEFRNRVSSYHLLDSQIHQRVALIIAVIAVLVAAPSLAYLFAEGTLTDWLGDLFTEVDPIGWTGLSHN